MDIRWAEALTASFIHTFQVGPCIRSTCHKARCSHCFYKEPYYSVNTRHVADSQAALDQQINDLQSRRPWFTLGVALQTRFSTFWIASELWVCWQNLCPSFPPCQLIEYFVGKHLPDCLGHVFPSPGSSLLCGLKCSSSHIPRIWRIWSRCALFSFSLPSSPCSK